VKLSRNGNAHGKKLKNNTLKFTNNGTENIKVGAAAGKINIKKSETNKTNEHSNLIHNERINAAGKLIEESENL
jgi:ribosomal protein S11